ncbi:MAG: radical SAM protein [Chloroflexota bacterium]
MVTKTMDRGTRAKAKRIGDEVELKLGMLTDGVCVDDSATAGYGTKYKEQRKWLFEWDHVTREERFVPEEVVLPEGTVVGVREDPESRYVLKAEDGQLVVLKDGKLVMKASHIPRPAYYGKKTSTGVDMGRILAQRGKDCLVYNFSTYCHYEKTGDQCHYCSSVWTHEHYRKDRIKPQKQYGELKETIAEAIKEGHFTHFLFTGGFHPKEVELLVRGMRAVKEAMGIDYMPGCLNHTAPVEREVLETLYQEGGGNPNGPGPIYNLEVWNPAYFRAICPGKDKVQGRDKWIQALKWSVEVFGKGKVSTFFVPGMEPIEYTLEGMEYCASIGVQPMGITWAVSRGSKFWRHRTPTVDWWLELNEKCADLWFKYGFVRPEIMDSAANPNVCIDCNFTTVVANIIHKRKLEEDPGWVYPLRPSLKRIARK